MFCFFRHNWTVWYPERIMAPVDLHDQPGPTRRWEESKVKTRFCLKCNKQEMRPA